MDEISWWGNVVSEATNGCRVASHVIFLPFADEGNKVVAFKFTMKYLTEEVEI